MDRKGFGVIGKRKGHKSYYYPEMTGMDSTHRHSLCERSVYLGTRGYYVGRPKNTCKLCLAKMGRR